MIFTAPLSAASLYSRDNMRRSRLVYGLAVTNRGSRVVKGVTVHIPEIQDSPPHQSATIKSVSPPAYTKEKSSAGVSMLKFQIDRISPGEKKKFLVSANVTTSEVIYHAREEDARNPDASMRQYLASEDYFTADSQALKAKCQEFLEEKNSLKRAFKIYEYIISGTFSFSDSIIGLGVDRCFEMKHLNCSDAAALYLVMCRLCGIPARYRGGILLKNKPQWYPLLHAWVEIYIPPYSWLPVDPTLGRLSEKNRQLCFAHIRNRYIALWNNQLSVFYIEAASEGDTHNLEVHPSVFAESY